MGWGSISSLLLQNPFFFSFCNCKSKVPAAKHVLAASNIHSAFCSASNSAAATVHLWQQTLNASSPHTCKQLLHSLMSSLYCSFSPIVNRTTANPTLLLFFSKMLRHSFSNDDLKYPHSESTLPSLLLVGGNFFLCT